MEGVVQTRQTTGECFARVQGRRDVTVTFSQFGQIGASGSVLCQLSAGLTVLSAVEYSFQT